jgi:hypothetical protein
MRTLILAILVLPPTADLSASIALFLMPPDAYGVFSLELPVDR